MNNKLRNVCKSYDVICNCEFLDDDLFSKKLVEFYKKHVSNVKLDNEAELRKTARFDRMVRRYIEDYNFSRKLQSSIDVSSIVNSGVDLCEPVLEYVSSFSDKYDEEANVVVTNTRWI